MKSKSLLYIDMAYTYEMIREKNHEEFFHSRHSAGYFQKVWGVHPLADLVNKNASKKIDFIRFSPDQWVIEGRVEGLRLPKFLMPLNFLLSQFRLIRTLVRLIKKNDISLIAATDPLYSGLFGMCLAKISKKPLAVYLYMNLDDVYEDTGVVTMPRLFPWRFLEKFIIRQVVSRADLVIGGNQNNLNFGLNNGARKDRSTVFPVSKNMYDGHLVEPALRSGAKETFKNYTIPEASIYLLYLGRHEKVKRPEEAIKAMKIVIDAEPGVIGLLAGDGSMRKELEALVSSYGLKDKILFLGNVDQKSLSEIIPYCITISPLTGMALIECGLGGSPIVAYHRDWQPDFIKDGYDGFIVPFRDYEALGKQALVLVRDEQLRAEFSERIRAKSLTYADTSKLYEHEHAEFNALFDRFEKRRLGAEKPGFTSANTA